MKKYRTAVCLILVFAMTVALSACGGPKVLIDYADAESFEAALRSGENLEGKVVQFVISEVYPNSPFGYSVSAGDGLYFIPQKQTDLKAGDTVTARATRIAGFFGMWFIAYEDVANAYIDDSTIPSADGKPSQPSESTFAYDTPSEPSVEQPPPAAVDEETPPVLPLQLTDYGTALSSTFGDTAYIDYCGMIHNPNEDLIATFPKIVITVKSGDGSILTTDHQTGSIVMPGDTIILCGMFSLPIVDVNENTSIYYNVEWSDLTTSTSHYSKARTTDFDISNISERSSDFQNSITGEITNNYTEDVDRAYLTLLLRKDGEIVFIDNTFVDNLWTGTPKAFQFSRYDKWPEHDTIDISAMVW